ncbi:MAG: O-succinylbenzoic acid--CoA ligase [Rhodothermales bacterium]|jgi:O-succinylbenzoic acid--CoA ligase
MTNPIEQAARAFGKGVMIGWDSGLLSFSDFHDAVNSETTSLVGLRGQRIGLKAPRSARDLTHMFALVLAGATVVLVGHREPEDAVTGLTKRFGLRWDPTGQSPANPGRSRAGSASEGVAPARQGTGRLVVLTSGSTGTPKAVVHTLDSLMASARGAAEHLKFGPGKRWPATLPMNHVGGLSIVFRALAGGGSVWLTKDQGDLEEALGRATHVSLVATQLHRLIRAARPSPEALEYALLGGSAFASRLLNEARVGRWPLVLSYGMSEMGSLVTATLPGELGNSGRALAGRRLRIGIDGEVEVSGSALFEGYLDGPGAGAWHKTGDLGSLDEAGHLHIIGRRDNMFVSGGENVHPEVIEAVLADVLGVETAVVVDVPDEEFGARPVAFVRGDATALALKDAVLRRLPAFMVPDAIYVFPDIGSGGLKPRRTELRRLARGLRG